MNRAQKRAKKKSVGGRGRHRDSYAIGMQHQIMHSSTVRLAAERQIQIFLWIFCVALHDEFGFGRTRFQRAMSRVDEIYAEWQHMIEDVDLEYATEKLRQKAEQISGMEVGYR